MNRNKEVNREHAKSALTEANIKWKSFNNDNHWKIGLIDFWPTTLKWIDNRTGLKNEGVMQLIEYMRQKYPMVTYHSTPQLSVQDLVKIATKVQPPNLMNICEAIHKEIYK